MLTHIAFFGMGFLSALLCAMVIVCCEAERGERREARGKNKGKNKENDK